MNGANTNGENYQPDVTSYDYDSVLDESGRPTGKYFAFRDLIAKATGITPPPVPKVADPISVPDVAMVETASLWENLPKPIRSEQVLSMEDVDQAFGYILYRTRMKDAASGDLVLDKLHSYAQIYLDGKMVGVIDRRLGQDRLAISAAAGSRMDILVENTGRVNFGKSIGGERAGITKKVTLAGKLVTGWEIYPLPMTAVGTFSYSKKTCEGPCFYRGSFDLAATADTFLDTSEFTKGQLWLNGRALGRIWNVGPQKTLYAPGSVLEKGKNEVIVFDVQGKMGAALRGLDKPELGAAATVTPK
jgi:beta-galactosidase